MNSLLVIEDDEEIREMLESLLIRTGYRVFTASHGRQGLRVVRDEVIDVVICDILMPVQEGIETIHAIKREFPGIQVIAMSGGGIVQPEDYLRTAEMFGAELSIAKPFEPDDILQAIHYLVSLGVEVRQPPTRTCCEIGPVEPPSSGRRLERRAAGEPLARARDSEGE